MSKCQDFFLQKLPLDLCEQIKKPGDDLLSHGLPAVPSAQEGLTSVFGMGTGGTPLLWSPDLHCHSDSPHEYRLGTT